MTDTCLQAGQARLAPALSLHWLCGEHNLVDRGGSENSDVRTDAHEILRKVGVVR